MDLMFLYYVIYACWRVWHESKTNQVRLARGEPVEFDDGPSYLGWTVGAALAVLFRSLVEGATTGWVWGGRVVEAKRAARQAERARRPPDHGRPDDPPRPASPASDPPSVRRPSGRRTGGSGPGDGGRTDGGPEPDDHAGRVPRTDGEPDPTSDVDAPKLHTRPAPDRPPVTAGEEPDGGRAPGPGGPDPVAGAAGGGRGKALRCGLCGETGMPFNRVVRVQDRPVHELICPGRVTDTPPRPPRQTSASGAYRDLLCRRCGVPLLAGERLVCGDCVARATGGPAGSRTRSAPADGARPDPETPVVQDAVYYQVVDDGVVRGQGDDERLVTWDALAPFAGDLRERLREATDRGDTAEAQRLEDQLYDVAVAVLDGTAAAPPAGPAEIAPPAPEQTPAAGPDVPAPQTEPEPGTPEPAGTTTETPAPAEPAQAPDPVPPGTTPEPDRGGLAPVVPLRPAEWTAVPTPGTPGPTSDPDRRPAAGGAATGGIPAMTMTASGETTNIGSTRHYFTELVEHLRSSIISELDLCSSTLSTAEMEDEDVTGAISQTREALATAAGAADAVLEALEQHRLMEQAVGATPGAANTGYYKQA